MTSPFIIKDPFGVVVRIPTPMHPRPPVSTLINNLINPRLANPFMRAGSLCYAYIVGPQVIVPAPVQPCKQIDLNGPSFAIGKTINSSPRQTNPFASSSMSKDPAPNIQLIPTAPTHALCAEMAIMLPVTAQGTSLSLILYKVHSPYIPAAWRLALDNAGEEYTRVYRVAGSSSFAQGVFH